MKTAIMTDTNSGILAEEGLDNGIFTMPMPIQIDGQDYLEGENITHDRVFAALKAGKSVSTSQPSPYDLQKCWDRILAEGNDEIVYIPMSGGLSGSLETAAMLAKDFSGKVQVVDNRRISMTLLDSVYDAKYMADHGQNAASIKKRLEENAAHSIIYIMVNDLRYIVKSGRITAAGAAVATVAGIRPVLKIEGGRLDAFARARGVKACENLMLEAAQNALREKFANIDKKRVHIGVAGTMTDAGDVEAWIRRIKDTFPDYDVEYRPLACSIACHIGSETKGISVGIVDRVNKE